MKLKLTIALLCMASFCFSQEDYMDKIAKKSCECLSTVKNTSNNQEQFNMELGLCMIEASRPYKAELKRDHGIDFTNIEVHGNKLGQLIGTRMATVCPSELMKVAKDMESNESSTPENLKFRGKVVKINTSPFVVFSVKDELGKVVKFYWMEYVNSDIDLSSDYFNLYNKTVEITYRTSELFSGETSKYEIFNILKAINLN